MSSGTEPKGHRFTKDWQQWTALYVGSRSDFNKERSVRHRLGSSWCGGTWTKQRSGPRPRPSPREERCKVISPWPELEFSMRATGLGNKSGRQTPTSKQRNRGRKMRILTPQEKSFLDVFLHEATTSPFTGPATQALHK